MIAAIVILILISGLLWGVREYYHKQPKVFDTLWKVAPKSFFGSQSWKLKYKDYDKGDKRPAFPLAITFPVNDFWHSSSYALKMLLILGSILSISISLPFGIPEVIAVYVALVFILQGVSAGLTFFIIDKLYKKAKNAKQNI